MKNFIVAVLLGVFCLSFGNIESQVKLSASRGYQVGDVVQDHNINAQIPGESSFSTSIYGEIDKKKPVLIFWGGNG